MAPFSVGDVVRLRSGSPSLTVVSTGCGRYGGDTVSVAWIKDGKVKSGSFPAATLERVPEPAPSPAPSPTIVSQDRELRYWRDVVTEQKQVIDQLANGPGEIEFIHPYDLAEILNRPHTQYLEIRFSLFDKNVVEFTGSGKRYKQSVYMPSRTKFIK